MARKVLVWDRIPVIIKSVLTGLVVAAIGATPWALLVSLNLKYASAIPWAVPVMAVYLWFYWRYVNGAWWPRANSAERKENCRVNGLSEDIWGAALMAGLAGLIFIALFQVVLSRLVNLPKQSIEGISQVPVVTLFFFVLMSALVAGVVEESAFRGYMQKPIEKKYGPAVAILVVGLVFGFAHFTHPEVSLALMPYYLTVATVYGMLAYLTNSILPSMVLHAGGNLLSSLGLFMTGDMEQPVATKPALLIWETGLDWRFLISCGATLLVGAITILAYRRLAIVARRNPRHVS